MSGGAHQGSPAPSLGGARGLRPSSRNQHLTPEGRAGGEAVLQAARMYVLPVGASPQHPLHVSPPPGAVRGRTHTDRPPYALDPPSSSS